ncbi:MAG: DNA mismatch repair endonuclease MutL [Bacteroidaceae bacterium]|nr:DNA mismatch repair endonuclease MutL [Bacteroidaceae bacterium]
MNDIIHLLPDSVANQIAAGEVIQRPASVIKELVENSIDAGATHVQILITDAGRTCIQVIDNGKGMSETDARLAFERHATSKIQKADDLFSLRTMGFRGEALASIAAVTEVELRTRREEDDLGVCLRIEGSRITSQEPVSCPVGANFAVRNIFFNIPARRKFLKSNHTELANILAEFERIALAHPDVAFTLSSNDQVLHQLPAGSFRQRLIGLFGKRLDSQLLPVDTDTELVRIKGFVGTPESAKKKNAQQFFITNSRFMRHPYFAKAIQTAYERLIPEGYAVPFFITLDLDPAQIDVNVHPTKTEIKFTDEQEIWQILLVAVREALGKHNAIPSLDFTATRQPDIPSFAPASAPQPPSLHLKDGYNPFHSAAPAARPAAQSQWKPLLDDILAPAPATPDAPTLFDELPQSTAQTWTRTSEDYLQYQGQYIITPATQGLLLIDQHRASERILYDKYRRLMREGHSATQGLLFPQILQVSAAQAATLDRIADDLTRLGFNVSNLGGGSYSILGIPTGTEGLDPVILLQGIIDDAHAATLADDTTPSDTATDAIHHLLATALARKAAMPQGELLTREEMARLTDELLDTSLPGYTADGRRIIITLTAAQLARFFT